jgi:hypothetical protein
MSSRDVSDATTVWRIDDITKINEGMREVNKERATIV